MIDLSATANFKPTTTTNTRTASCLAPIQLKHHRQALLPEQIEIALQHTTLQLEENKPTLPTQIIERAVVRRADKAHAETTQGKLKYYDPDHHKHFQGNHVNGQQQQLPAIMPPPYMYQANAALPPLAPRVHFNQDRLVSSPFALDLFAKFSETIN